MSATVQLSTDADGHWVTINGEHVFIGGNGTITKGPASMVGKKPSDVGEVTAEHGKTHPQRTKIGKGNSGDVFREGDEVVKTAKGREGEVYKKLNGVEGIADGRQEGNEIRLPHYKNIASTDAVPAERRKGVAPIIEKNIDRLLNGVNAISEAGYDYNDPLQVGFDANRKAHIFDFSNVDKVSPEAAMRANIGHLKNYLKDFGLEDEAKRIGHTFDTLEGAKMGKDSRDFLEDDVRARLDSRGMGDNANNAKYAYYAKNARHIAIAGVAQSEPANGFKVILSEKPLADSQISQWELTPVIHPAKRNGTTKMSNYYLSTATTADLKPAVTLGQGYPTHLKLKVGDDEREVPVAYFWKDSIQAGEYVHPATKQKLKVDANRIDGWVDKFHQMRAAGIEIPTPTDHSSKAEDNLGFVIDAKRNGDRLSLLHQVIGEDAAMTALRNRCSLCIEPDYVDEKGKSWGDAFTHSAFTPVPVVSGMGSFVPFAASRDRQTETPIFYLSADERNPDMDFKQLREALGATADVPDDKLLESVKELRTTASADAAKVTELTGKVQTLSRAPAQPDPEILRDRNESKREKIEISMSRGDLPKLVADKLLAALPADKPSAFMLSRADELQATPVDFILSLFKDSQLGVATGSQTGVQSGVVLSREVPGQLPDADKKLAEVGEAQGKAFVEAQLAHQRR